MEGDKKKSGCSKRMKPKEGGFESDDDEPIGSLLKLKRSRKSKKNTLGVDDGGGRDKMFDKKGANLPVQEDFGGMEDTLASFRKKLKRPKKVSGSGICKEQSSGLSVLGSRDPISNSSRGEGDLDMSWRPEKGESMDREESDPSAKIDVGMAREAPDFESKDIKMGTRSGKGSKCSFDKQLDDSLSVYVQKIQSGSTRKSLVSTTCKPECKDVASEDKLSNFSRLVSADQEIYSIVNSNSNAKLAQVVTKPNSELTTSVLVSCSLYTKENCNHALGQCQGVDGGREENQYGLNNYGNPDIKPCISNKVADEDSKKFSHIQFGDTFQSPERKASCEIKNGPKHYSYGDAMEHNHFTEVVSLQDGLGESHLNENMHNSCHALERVNENHGLCGGVSNVDFFDVVAQESTINLLKTTSSVDCEGNNRLMAIHHDEFPNSTNVCKSYSKEISKSTKNLMISDQSYEGPTLSNLQLLAAFESMKVDKNFSDYGNFDTGTVKPRTKVDSMQAKNDLIPHRISDSTAVQSHKSQKSVATTSKPNYPEVWSVGNFSMISDNSPAKAVVEIDGSNNSILAGKEIRTYSPGSLTPDNNDLEDVISAPSSEKDLKLSTLQRVVRKTKKPRHDDMAYEGDIYWEVLIDERAVDSDRSFRSRRDSTSTTFTEAETCGRAAVSAGLKVRAVSLLEKIKFKEVLKRKGGLQEYLACRNKILGLWCKDVTRILHLADCGVTNPPSMDEPPRFPLIREIYAFLNLHGYINAGIASEQAKTESDFMHDCELGEKKVGNASVASVADSEEGVSVMVKNFDAKDNIENGVSAGCELLPEATEGSDLVSTNSLELPKPVKNEQELVYDMEYGTLEPIPRKLVGIDVPGKATSHLTNHSRNGWHPINSSDECIGGDEQQLSNSEIRKRVIVIGAGPAGLTAAKHLHRQGFTVNVLEARNRLGGRVYTDRSSLSVPVDLGASIITGVEADVATERRPDPSSLICTQLGLDLTVLKTDCPLYDIITCKKVPLDMDEALEAEFNSLLDDTMSLVKQREEHVMTMSLEEGLEYALKRRRTGQLGMDVCSEEEVLSPFERRVMNWHFANLEYGCAAMLKKVSLPHWNQDDLYGGFGGAHCMIKGGYSNVVESLGRGLNVHLNHIVADISYSTNDENQQAKVKVSTTNGCEFLGDAVLVTVSLGCLKAESIKFSPPLPEWKRLSIQRLGFGVLNKIVLEFPEVFWDDSVDYFGATAEETKWRGQCFTFWNVRKTVGAPVLIALVVGQAAVDRQYLSSSDNVSHALMVLRKLFGEAVVPDPVASVVTDWGKDPFSYGAYSYVAVGASGEDYDILARPVRNCLFFAGEATCKEHPDTVGGAMMSGLREAVRMIDVLHTGYDYTAEVEAMEAAQRQSECENDEVGDIMTRLDAVKLSDALNKKLLDVARILTIEALLQDLFSSAKTTAGRLHVAKELLNLPVETLKSFAGTKDGLTVLNSWIRDSMGKNGTQLLRQCVRILVLVSTDLLAVRLSGIGKTVKEKVCMHTSRDIRAIGSQLVSIWLEVFRKEKAANGGLKFSKPVPTVESLKRKSNKDFSSGKPPLHANNSSLDSRGNLPSSAILLPSDVRVKNDNSKLLKPEMDNSSKSDISSSRSRGSFGKQDAEMEDNDAAMTEEEQAAFAAAEAARAAALEAAKVYASSEAKCALQLPKIPSFHKFARREHYAQMDECESKRKLSGSVLGRQDCISEIDSRNCRVRDWSVDFSAACVNLESSRMSADNLSQRTHSNEIVSQLNFREHSGESAPEDSSIYTKAWVDTAGSVGMKDYHAIERWRSQAAAAHVIDEEDSNTAWKKPSWNSDQVANESSISQVTINKEPVRNHHRGADKIKQAVVDYVASLLMPLYTARKIDKDGYKSIMKKIATKVMEQATDAEKGMTVSEFLDFKRRNKIRAFVDKLIERHIATKPAMKS